MISISAAGAKLRDGPLTALELTKSCLQRIKKLDPELHAFITVSEEQALAQAAERDRELRDGIDRGPLHGIPIAHKDIFDTAGIRTTIGSGLFANRVPQKSAALVEALDRAGAIVVGKTSMPEFATDPSGRNWFFGDLHNPRDRNRSAGGSSGGTAAAVTAQMCVAGTGSDTGGSIRIPASWCGVVGLRPTFGLVSLDGTHPRATSLDTAGPIASTVFDCALMLNGMIIDAPEDYGVGLGKDCRSLTLGVFAEFPDTDREVVDAIFIAVEQFAKLGVNIVTVRDPFLSGATDDTDLLDVLLYEFNQIMAETYWKNDHRDEVFGPVVHANVARGARVSHERYRAVLSNRPRLLDQAKAIFKTVDAIVTPTTAVVAPPLDAEGGVYAYVSSRRFTLPSGFIGLPSLSVPCGLNSEGLPIGLQLTADIRREALLLRLGAAYESMVEHAESKLSVAMEG